MPDFKEYRTRFKRLYAKVKALHQESSGAHRGHGLDHDVAVAQMAALIAPDPRTGDKAWVAGLIHSTDHLVDKVILESTLRDLVKRVDGYFTLAEREEIFVAAFKHWRLNEDDDSLTLQVLKDADRLVNLNVLTAIRGGQFLPNIPAIEINQLGRLNPKSTYSEPASVLDNVRYVHAFVQMSRTEKAKKMGEELGRKLEQFIKDAEQMYYDLDLAGVEL
jgi:hypothetical protein